MVNQVLDENKAVPQLENPAESVKAARQGRFGLGELEP